MLNQNKDTDMICRFILSVGLILSCALPIAAADEPPWKWDVTIYDRPGWSATWLPAIKLLPNDDILLQVEAYNEAKYHDDFYADEADLRTLLSKDGGRSWKEVPNEVFPSPSVVTLDNGAMLRLTAVFGLPAALDKRRRERLEKAGLGHLADVDGWTIFPEAMATELREMGYGVHDSHPSLPVGQCAVTTKKIKAERSSDGGKTWTPATVTGPPAFGRGPGFWDHNFATIGEHTVLRAFAGHELGGGDVWAYVVRSTDGGRNWKVIKAAAVPGLHLDEPEMIAWPDGRVLLTIRASDYHVYTAVSKDGGLTWGKPVKTDIVGQPQRSLLLKDGKVLCTYAYRMLPAGARGCYSYDRGKTWDLENEIILRNDIIPTYWISGMGPRTVQLNDGTLFSAYTIVRVVEEKEGDHITNVDFSVNRARYHCVAVGSRYTENYAQPLPWKRK